MNCFRIRVRMVFLAVAVCALLLASGSARADLIPNGNPTGPAVANSTNVPGGFSALTPSPAISLTRGATPAGWNESVISILQTEMYAGTTGANPTAIWNFAIAANALQGGIQLNQYFAWADQTGAITNGAASVAATPNGNYGGAAIALTYAPSTQMGTTDPQLTLTPYPSTPAGATGIAAGTYYGFIQVIRDNDPTNFETQQGIISNDGFTYSTDNEGSVNGAGTPTSPFYNVGFAASQANFIDVPFNPYNGADIEFGVFVATDTVTINDGVTTNNVTLYDGVNWGFTVSTPEPSSMTLCAIGAISFAVITWIRGKRKKAAVAEAT